jgi:hypothetical protein
MQSAENAAFLWICGHAAIGVGGSFCLEEQSQLSASGIWFRSPFPRQSQLSPTVHISGATAAVEATASVELYLKAEVQATSPGRRNGKAAAEECAPQRRAAQGPHHHRRPKKVAALLGHPLPNEDPEKGLSPRL